MISFEQTPESLVQRIRALADKRQKEAARERKVVAQGLLGAANGYRALADALERQPILPWLRPSGLAARMGAAAGNDSIEELETVADFVPAADAAQSSDIP